MKKLLALIASAMLFTSSLAHAAGSDLASGSTTSADAMQIYGDVDSTKAGGTTGTLIGKCSKGVWLGAKYDNTGYSLNTKHISGNTTFGTAFDATAIYKMDTGTPTSTSTAPLSAPTQIGSAAFAATGWTAM